MKQYQKAKSTVAKLDKTLEETLKKFAKTVEEIRTCVVKIQTIVYQDQIYVDYLYKLKTLPSQPLSSIKRSFDFLPSRQQKKRSATFPQCKYVKMLNNKMENERAIAKIAMRNKCSNEGEVVGTSFFMVCEN